MADNADEDMAPLVDRSEDKIRKEDEHFKFHTIGIIQAGLYLASVVFSLIVVIEVGETVQDFNHRCPLMSQVVWDNKVFYPTNENICNYVVFTGISVGIFFSVFMCIFSVAMSLPITWRRFKGVGRLMFNRSDSMIRGLNPIFMFLNFAVFCLLLGQAIILSAGLYFTCNQMLGSLQEQEEKSQVTEGPRVESLMYDPDGEHIEVNSCPDTQNIDWTKFSIIGGYDTIHDGSRFFNRLLLAVFASWIVVILWIVMIVINCGLCFRNCSCEIAEEKRMPDKTLIIAQRRSRMATPIGTPGHMTPMGRTPLPSVGSTLQSGVPSQMGPGPYQPPTQQPGPRPPPPHMGGPPMGGPPRMRYPPPMGPPRMAGQGFAGPPPMGMPQYMGPGGPMRPPPPRGYQPQGQVPIRGLPPKVSDSAC